MELLDEFINKKAISRRNFLAGAGTTAAAAVLVGCGDNGVAIPATPATTTFTDADILNFALNLEYLEAEFYLRAATGSGLATADAGTGAGAVTGGSKVPNLTAAQQQILNEIAYDEQAHVQFLRSALGSSAVARPTIDFTSSFPALATAAGITGITFNPFADFDSFLVGAFIFEDVGVTAYHGAAPLISTAGITAGYLTAAAGILAVEAYHAAYVRTALTGRAIAAASASPATAYPYLGFANSISALRASVGGGNETTLKLPTTTATASSIVAADTTNAIAFSRSTDQVLHIVYGTGGGSGLAKGAFFPSGLNGTIKVTAA
ncbi:ferritin-like domain-containing protein [Granulicella sp. dw_53]|uniref:ferritin-like domain-containing protein n=1 Tax=Granulicella sp. dw_53 TaxID=2719792 RepID=UPI001BD53982|nr:ferritin-like domain-containing protein [Granulicella sp. dw_53]